MSSESRIWEIRPFGSMRGESELVLGRWASQPNRSRLLYRVSGRFSGLRAPHGERIRPVPDAELSCATARRTRIALDRPHQGMVTNGVLACEPGWRLRSAEDWGRLGG